MVKPRQFSSTFHVFSLLSIVVSLHSTCSLASANKVLPCKESICLIINHLSIRIDNSSLNVQCFKSANAASTAEDVAVILLQSKWERMMPVHKGR